MILPEKVARLKHSGLSAVRLAMLWEEKMAAYGVKSAEDLYLSLGHNHIERKSTVDWEGMTLSREPKDHEKLCIKGIAGAQESAKEKVIKILLELRKELILDGLKGIKKLPVAQYHELTLQASSDIRQSLRDRLIKIHKQGRLLVAAELGKKADIVSDDGFDELDDLTDLTDGRVLNEMQARVVAAAARYTLLGLAGKVLWDAVEKEVGDGSTGWLDRAATGVANKTLNVGRADEAQARKDEWEKIVYSAILDPSLCEVCASDDGEESTDEADLEPVPNSGCLGGDWCRCFWVYITA